MDRVWLSYRELADRLGTSAEGARRRVQRGRWTRRIGNDGHARVQVPEDVILEPRPVRAEVIRPDSTGEKSAPDGRLVASLEAHVETLKAQLAAAEAHIESFKAQLSAAETRAGEESAKTAQAIAAFEGLAKRLEAMAKARRPLWHRLLWRG